MNDQMFDPNVSSVEAVNQLGVKFTPIILSELELLRDESSARMSAIAKLMDKEQQTIARLNGLIRIVQSLKEGQEKAVQEDIIRNLLNDQEKDTQMTITPSEQVPLNEEGKLLFEEPELIPGTLMSKEEAQAFEQGKLVSSTTDTQIDSVDQTDAVKTGTVNTDTVN